LFGKKYNVSEIVSQKWTALNVFRENVSLYILRMSFGYPSFTTSPYCREKELKQLKLTLADIESPLALCWNTTHIWACRRLQGCWYKFDSLLQKPVSCALSEKDFISFVYPNELTCLRLKNALQKNIVRKGNQCDMSFFFVYMLLKNFYKNKIQIERFAENVHLHGVHYFKEHFSEFVT
tara:strand:+ start:479 stop:1015 length:537 start_codon:yes stop_codon:yes gene_type:complete